MLVRRERADDIPTVGEVIGEAFARSDASPGEPPPEVSLLEALRADAGWVPELSLVAECDGEVVGHVVCTRGTVGDTPAVGLGPIGVRAAHQRDGVGKALMHAVLGAADAMGIPVVALLGSTDYYPQFGFVPATSLGIEPPEPLWGDHFQVRALATYDPSITGAFTYAAPFNDPD